MCIRDRAYLDFEILKKIFYLYSVTTQMRQSAIQNPNLAWRTPDVQLELSLLIFAERFKSYVLTDSRIIALASRLGQDQRGQQDNGEER